MNKLLRAFKQITKVILIFVLSITLALVLLSFWARVGVFSNQTFNKKEWFAMQTNESDSACYRGGMAMHIKEFLLNDTMSKTDVMSLLGRPDSEVMNQVEYTLGMCSGLGIDYDGLVIHFDNNDKFAEASIIQH